MDLDIPFRLGGFTSTTIQFIDIVGVITEVTWQILLLIVPMGYGCLLFMDAEILYGFLKGTGSYCKHSKVSNNTFFFLVNQLLEGPPSEVLDKKKGS